MGKHTLTCNESKGDGTLVLEKLLRWNFSWNLGFAGTVVLTKAMVPASFQLIGLMSVRWPWEFIWDSSLNTPFQKRNNVSSWKKSSIFIGFSIINHPFWGTIILGNPQICFQTKVQRKPGVCLFEASRPGSKNGNINILKSLEKTFCFTQKMTKRTSFAPRTNKHVC